MSGIHSSNPPPKRGPLQFTYHTFQKEDVVTDCPYCGCSSILDCNCRIPPFCDKCGGGVHIWIQHATREIAIICSTSDRSPANCTTPPCIVCNQKKCICCNDCSLPPNDCRCCTECGPYTMCSCIVTKTETLSCGPCGHCPETTKTVDVVICDTCNGHILDCACFTGLYQCLTQTTFCRKCNGDANLVVQSSGETALICTNSDLPHDDCRYCRYCEQKLCVCCYNCYGPPSECTCCKTCGDPKDQCDCGLCRNCGYPEGDRRCTCEEDYQREQDEFLYQSSFPPSPCEDCGQMYCRGC